MKIAFVTRSTLYTVPGGDTIQILETAKHLRELGIEADICLTNAQINYGLYDLLHFTNIIRPSDILFHIGKTKKPFVLTPVLVDYHEYDKHHRKGFSGFVLRSLSTTRGEYAKTFARWIAGKDKLKSKTYLWKGHRESIQQIIKKAALLLPNSEAEYKKLEQEYGIKKIYWVVPNGIDPNVFAPDEKILKDEKMVLCVARIEGLKNQLNLIKALNNTAYTLVLVGAPAPNQMNYYNECTTIAAKNIQFRDHMPQEVLLSYYKTAKVHALPSWFETCGLSSLEAAAMGCNVMITDKGYTREYFRDDAFYCNPGDPGSIFKEIEKAATSIFSKELQDRIFKQYTWQRAASITADAYKKILQE